MNFKSNTKCYSRPIFLTNSYRKLNKNVTKKEIILKKYFSFKSLFTFQDIHKRDLL